MIGHRNRIAKLTDVKGHGAYKSSSESALHKDQAGIRLGLRRRPLSQ